MWLGSIWACLCGTARRPGWNWFDKLIALLKQNWHYANHLNRTGALMFTRAYLRASTSQQDATRARSDLERFASEHGLKVAAWYVENESGASLQRPELFRLLADSSPGDVLLIEQV